MVDLVKQFFDGGSGDGRLADFFIGCRGVSILIRCGLFGRILFCSVFFCLLLLTDLVYKFLLAFSDLFKISEVGNAAVAADRDSEMNDGIIVLGILELLLESVQVADCLVEQGKVLGLDFVIFCHGL